MATKQRTLPPVKYADDWPCPIRAHHERLGPPGNKSCWCCWCGMQFRVGHPSERSPSERLQLNDDLAKRVQANRAEKARRKRARRAARASAWMAALEAQGYRCGYCDGPFDLRRPWYLQVHDHLGVLVCRLCLDMATEMDATDEALHRG